MKNKTAVNWLEAEFLKLEQLIGVHGCMYELIEKAKELERQQIIDALHYFGIENAEEYYNLTYGATND